MADALLRRRLLLLLPLGIAAAGGVGFFTLLGRMRTGAYDPKGVPSPLIGRRLPAFALPGLGDGAGFSDADLVAQAASARAPVLLNFFASWCAPCIIEAPQLMALKRRGVAIWGVAYKDKPDAAKSFLGRHGDPYARLAADAPGRVAIEFGLYGVPETYLIDREGIIRWRWAGPLTDDTLRYELDPLLIRYG